MTTSRPLHASIGQLEPYGPRIATWSPTRFRARALVTLPAIRIVCRSTESPGSELTEIADSPTPGT